MFLFQTNLVQRQITPNGYHNNRDISSPSHNDSDYKYGRFDASALHIAHALKQTEIQKAYNKRREKPIDYYLVSKFVLEFISNHNRIDTFNRIHLMEQRNEMFMSVRSLIE